VTPLNPSHPQTPVRNAKPGTLSEPFYITRRSMGGKNIPKKRDLISKGWVMISPISCRSKSIHLARRRRLAAIADRPAHRRIASVMTLIRLMVEGRSRFRLHRPNGRRLVND
jgi:hypothetical protein